MVDYFFDFFGYYWNRGVGCNSGGFRQVGFVLGTLSRGEAKREEEKSEDYKRTRKDSNDNP